MHGLAIVIPYYKLTFFRETLQSLADQTDQRFRVYIGNDASPENPEKLLEEYIDKFDFEYKRFANNLGAKSLTQQWERCIEMMQDEEWFMILGDDDCLSSNAVEDFLINLREVEVGGYRVIRFPTILINGDGQMLSDLLAQPKLEFPMDAYLRKLQGDNRSSLSEYIFKVFSYRKFGFKDYPQAWGADDRAVIDFTDGKQIYSLSKSFVEVRMSTYNISSAVSDRHLKEKANLQSIRELIFDYEKIMNPQQLRFFIKVFEHRLFSAKCYKINDVGKIIYLFLKYMPFKYSVYLFKVLAANCRKISWK